MLVLRFISHTNFTFLPLAHYRGDPKQNKNCYEERGDE